MTLQIIATGGTIDKDYSSGKGVYDFHIGEPVAEQILKQLNYANFHTTSLLKKDSRYMTSDDRNLVAQYIANAKGRDFLVTHGTDTMIETAFVVQKIIGSQKKRIIFTGSSRPYSMKETDAVLNVKNAVQEFIFLTHYGCYIAMNNRFFSHDNVQKCEDGVFRELTE